MYDILICGAIPMASIGTNLTTAFMGSGLMQPETVGQAAQYRFNQECHMVRIPQGETSSTRIVGLKLGTNTDGSYKIALLGNNAPYRTSRNVLNVGLLCGVSGTTQATDNNLGGSVPTVASTGYYVAGSNKSYYAYSNGGSGISGGSNSRTVTPTDSIDTLPGTWKNEGSTTSTLEKFSANMTSANQYLTTDQTNTVVFGINSWENAKTYMGGNVGPLVTDVFIDPIYAIETSKIDPTLGLTGKVLTYIDTRYGSGLGIQENFVFASNAFTFGGDTPLHYSSNDYYFGLQYNNLHITSDYDKAIAYLNTGAIPDDDEYTEKNPDTLSPYDHDPEPPTPPEPDESQVGNEGNDIDDTTTATYGANSSVALEGVNWYYIQKNILTSFIEWFWNDSVSDWSAVFFNAITGLYGNLSNAIISLKKMHVDERYIIGESHNTSLIKLGRYTCSLSDTGNHLQEIDREPSNLVPVGSYKLDKTSGIYNFLDYSPYTSVNLYLPYVGVVPLDTRYVRDETLAIDCVASFMTGEIMYCVKVGNTIVNYYQGKASIDVPLSLSSGMEIASNAINALGSTGVSIAGGGVLGATNLLGQNISTPISNTSQVTTALNMYGGTKCAIIVQRPEYYKLYDTSQGKSVSDYAHVAGYKYNCIRTFSVGDGYVEFDNPHIDKWDTAPSQEEVEEIYNLMKEGIVL